MENIYVQLRKLLTLKRRWLSSQLTLDALPKINISVIKVQLSSVQATNADMAANSLTLLRSYSTSKTQLKTTHLIADSHLPLHMSD